MMHARTKGTHLSVSGRDALNRGSVGQRMLLQLDETWEGLAVTAVFSDGEESRDVPVLGERIRIPAALLHTAGRSEEAHV